MKWVTTLDLITMVQVLKIVETTMTTIKKTVIKKTRINDVEGDEDDNNNKIGTNRVYHTKTDKENLFFLVFFPRYRQILI
jgi:hypothetical protein